MEVRKSHISRIFYQMRKSQNKESRKITSTIQCLKRQFSNILYVEQQTTVYTLGPIWPKSGYT